MACLLCDIFSVATRAQFVVEEQLTGLIPEKTDRVVLLPFENTFNVPVEIDSVTSSCGCNRDLVFEKTLYEVGEKSWVELRFKTGPKTTDVQIGLVVKGRRIGVDADHHASVLASYKLAGVVQQPVDLRSASEAFVIREDVIPSISIVNRSGTSWVRAFASVTIDDRKIASDVKIIEDVAAQTDQFLAVALSEPSQIGAVVKGTSADIRLFASVSNNQKILQEVGRFTVPVKLFSGAEVMPKTISRNGDGNFRPINIVGRAFMVGDMAENLKISIDGVELISGKDFVPTRLSSKWLRIDFPMDTSLSHYLKSESQLTLRIVGHRWFTSVSFSESIER